MKWIKPEFENTFSYGKGGPQQDVDIMLGGMVTKGWCLITKGGGGQEAGKKWLHNTVICKLLSN